MKTTVTQATTIVDEIFGLYHNRGHEDYIGEPVSQLEHMSQMATLAMDEGHSDEVVLAAFFHDIGHLCVQDDNRQMDGFGVKEHEQAGASYLKERGFADRLIKLVKSHVTAKRYLVFKMPEYYDQLSEASKATLVYQGGKMNGHEAAALEQDPDFNLILRLRYWDEQAKIAGVAVENLPELKQMALHYLLSRGVS